MEQRYEFHPENPEGKKEQNRKMAPRKKREGFLYLWSGLLVKCIIGFIVSMVALTIFEVLALVKASGIDLSASDAASQFSQFISTYYAGGGSQYNEMVEQLYAEFVKFTTPIEGFSALLAIPAIAFMYHKDQLVKKMEGFVENRKASAVKYMFIIVLALCISLGINSIFAISGLLVTDQSYVEVADALTAASFGVQYLCLGLLVPICEELVYRGIMFGRMRKSASFVRAAIYSSVIFGIFHGNTVQTIQGFFIGLLFCYLYEKYGSVIAPIIAHIFVNVGAVFMNQFHILERLMKDDFLISCVTVGCATLGGVMFVFIRRIDEKPVVVEEEEQIEYR